MWRGMNWAFSLTDVIRDDVCNMHHESTIAILLVQDHMMATFDGCQRLGRQSGGEELPRK